jgi:predicted secreted hydrolase
MIERESKWGNTQVYMGHFAISDIDSNKHYSFEKFSRAAPGLAGSQSTPFHVWLENWEVVQSSDDEWRMFAAQEGVEIELNLYDEKGVIFHGDSGYSQKGADKGNASYYFSQTRLESAGSLVINGTTFEVTGFSWMDHEFSTSALSDDQVGWDWFSIQLDNDMELMVFQIRRADGSVDPFSSGTLIDSKGETLHLDRNQFEIDVLDTWRSPHTDAIYPAAWRIRIPQIGLTLDLRPYLADQELNVSYAYWEGAVDVTGVLGDQVLSGSGYVELTGYAKSMEGEF